MVLPTNYIIGRVLIMGIVAEVKKYTSSCWFCSREIPAGEVHVIALYGGGVHVSVCPKCKNLKEAK